MGRPGHTKDVPLLGRDTLTRGNKEVAGIQESVAEKFPAASVVGVSATLGLHHNNPNSEQIVFGAVVVLKNLDLRISSGLGMMVF